MKPNAPRLCLLFATLAACSASPPPPSATDALDLAIPAAFTNAPERARASTTIPESWWSIFAVPGLDELVVLGLQHNRDLQAALARLQAAAATATIAGAPAWPTVDAGLDAQRARRLFLGFPFGGGGVPSSTTTTFGLSLSMRWELDLWGRVRAGESAALADRQAVLADVQGARLSLAGQICRAWFTAVEARQQLALAEATVAAFRATADDVRDRYRRGVRPALDVHLASTNLANAEATVTGRSAALQRALRQLDVLVGRYPSGRQATAFELPTKWPEVPAALPSELLGRRPDLLAAERRLAAAGCRVDAARAALYPALALTASGGTASEELQDLVDDDFRVWSIGANLLAPLFRGGALRGEVARQTARAAEALANFGGTLLRAFAEVEDVLAAEQTLAARRDQLAAAARHARAARDLARERYQRGLTDFLAVADGQRQAFAADSALIALDRERWHNRVDLYLALGGGMPTDTVTAAAEGKPAGGHPIGEQP